MKLIRKQKQKTAFNRLAIAIAVLCAGGELAAADAKEKNKAVALEEVVVTAQKREQSLQDTPIAISVLNAEQLEQQGVSSLGDLADGLVPSLRIQPWANAPSTLIMTIRGNGPGDIAQATREGSVAVYMDDFYLGRPQSLDMELIDLERIEVLRGPQGTLFGRNATGGAVSFISKRPTGEFGLKQTVKVGRFNQHSSNTHIDLPEFAGLRTKLDYLFSERDGWVDNTAPNQADYSAYKKRGGRITVDWQASRLWDISYFHQHSRTDMVQDYAQLYVDNIGIIGAEPERQTKTRFPIAPLEPTKSSHQQHGLTFNWNIAENLAVKSLTSYRELKDKTRNNYGGALYFNGFIESVDREQQQFSQEIRVIGKSDHLEWVAGLYYYNENIDETLRNLFSLDIFGDLTGTELNPINPPITAAPERVLLADFSSKAVYGQATWTPPVLDEKLSITLGLRHTNDKRNGSRISGGDASFNLETHQTDPTVTLEYRPTDVILAYAKWSNGYRSGGVSSRSRDLTPYNLEEVDTFELGLKMELWDQRVRLSTALFTSDYNGMFIDFFDPNALEYSETINATNNVEVSGGELELALKIISGLTTRLNYTYLSGDLPLQPNPYDNNNLEHFNMTQTPRHAGSFSLNYVFPKISIGTLAGQVDVVSSSPNHHFSHGGPGRQDGYTIVNARLTLSDLSMQTGKGRLKTSLWTKNITNEEYATWSVDWYDFVLNAYNAPRTYGIDVTYQY